MKKLLLCIIAFIATSAPLRAEALQHSADTHVVQSQLANDNSTARFTAVTIEQVMQDLCLSGILDFLNQIKNLLDAIANYVQALGDLFSIGIEPPTFNPNCFQNPTIQLPDFSSCLMAGIDIGSFNCDCQLPNLDFMASIQQCLDQFQIDLGSFDPSQCIGLPDIQIPDLWGQLSGLLDLIMQLLDLRPNLDLSALGRLQIACAEGVTIGGARTGGSSLVRINKKKLCKSGSKKGKKGKARRK